MITVELPTLGIGWNSYNGLDPQLYILYNGAYTRCKEICMKKCQNCSDVKDESEFHKSKSRKDGLNPWCKSCVKKYQDDNKEKKNKRSKQYYEDNRDYYLEYSKEYKRNNKDRVSAQRTKYRQENADKIRQDNLEYQRNNPLKIKAFQHRRRTLLLNAEGDHTDKDIEMIYLEQNGLCAYCGVELNGKFELDHIYPLSRGGSNSPSNLACACVRCNRSKNDKTLDEWMGVK